jgi:hypothetical protein
MRTILGRQGHGGGPDGVGTLTFRHDVRVAGQRAPVDHDVGIALEQIDLAAQPVALGDNAAEQRTQGRVIDPAEQILFGQRFKRCGLSFS